MIPRELNVESDRRPKEVARGFEMNRWSGAGDVPRAVTFRSEVLGVGVIFTLENRVLSKRSGWLVVGETIVVGMGRRIRKYI